MRVKRLFDPLGKVTGWVAYPLPRSVELYQPHVLRLEGVGLGVMGRTPFEALSRAQKLQSH